MMYDDQSRLYRYRHPLIAFLITLFLLLLHGSYSAKTSSAQHLVTQQVTITQHGFLPNQLACGYGDSVSLTIVNADTEVHNFVISELGVATAPLSSGQSATLSFVAERQGTFTYLSNTPGYPEINLCGRFTVK